MAFIDAPETKQLWGPAAKAALQAKLSCGDQVLVVVTDTDQYGRSVSLVLREGEDVNLAQVADGAAWLYTAYLKAAPREVRALYETAFEAARRTHRGLWGAPGEGAGGAPLNPREWRRLNPRAANS
jgi:endonuclease YncB( thermonuclease family)